MSTLQFTSSGINIMLALLRSVDHSGYGQPHPTYTLLGLLDGAYFLRAGALQASLNSSLFCGLDAAMSSRHALHVQ
jgi:hypothetical protein